MNGRSPLLLAVVSDFGGFEDPKVSVEEVSGRGSRDTI